MAYDSLRDFVQKLDATGELKRISVEVDPVWKSPKSRTAK